LNDLGSTRERNADKVVDRLFANLERVVASGDGPVMEPRRLMR
jgi:hypothetical protein